jgi:hypothetical protein
MNQSDSHKQARVSLFSWSDLWAISKINQTLYNLLEERLSIQAMAKDPYLVAVWLRHRQTTSAVTVLDSLHIINIIYMLSFTFCQITGTSPNLVTKLPDQREPPDQQFRG